MLNDALGSVEVTLADDFSHIDPMMTAGITLTLLDDQAEIYVRQRMSVGVSTNEARMARQEEYLSKLIDALTTRTSDEQYIRELYDEMEPYLMTNMGRGRLINEFLLTREYAHLPTIHPSGTHEVAADGFMQFHPDEIALEQTMMGLFYEKVK